MSSRRVIDGAIGVLAAAALCFSGFNIYLWNQASSRNTIIARFAAMHDTALPRHAPADLRAARGLMLLAQDRVDDAQAEFDAIGTEDDSPSRMRLLYALANAHLRRAMDLFNTAPMRKVAPLIGLAQSEYRQVLRAQPENWDARYNFDVASGLTHEPGAAAYLKGDDMARERALVPDAPGAPNGMP